MPNKKCTSCTAEVLKELRQAKQRVIALSIIGVVLLLTLIATNIMWAVK